MFDFSGQRIVITGASRGIGKAIAELFLRSGAFVIGIYHENTTAVEKFLDETETLSPRLAISAIPLALSPIGP